MRDCIWDKINVLVFFSFRVILYVRIKRFRGTQIRQSKTLLSMLRLIPFITLKSLTLINFPLFYIVAKKFPDFFFQVYWLLSHVFQLYHILKI